MSTSIVNKIVEMKFNNQNFESGARQTLSTLEKLKQSLGFKGAVSGIESVASAVKNVSFSGIQNGVETVTSRFSMLGVMGVTALVNITNQAINTGKQIVNALAIQPITTGLNEYETKLNAIQTILANTKQHGTTLNDVNKTLNDLNHYADKTIYNFQQMTSAIGQFTTAGVDLETSASSIKGIANLAAFVGAPAQDASRAMFQLSQALSTGKVRLTDWMSLEHTAGMGGKAFQDALIRTARVLKDSNVNVDDAIKKNGNFRDSLKENWLTTNVLTETLKQFAGEVDAATLKSQGFTDAQIKEIQETAKLAEENATVVKTFTQLKDTLGEAAQSGWAETWEIIFGDLDEARALWTSVNNVIGGIIDRSAEARNAMLHEWKELGGRTEAIESIGNIWKYFTDIVGPIKEVFENIFPRTTGKQLYDITHRFLEFTKTLQFTEAKALPLQSIFSSIFKTIRNGINLVISLVNTAKTIFTTAFKAFKFVFPFDSMVDGAKKLGRAISQLKPTFSISGETTRRLSAIFKGFFSIIDIGIQAVKALYEVASPYLPKIFKPFESFGEKVPKMGTSLLGYMARLGQTITRTARIWKENDTIKKKFEEWLPVVKKHVQPVIDIFSKVKNAFSNVFKSLTGMSFGDIFKKIGETFRSGFDSVIGFISGLADGSKKIDLSGVWENLTKALGPFGSVLNGLKDFVKGLGDLFVAGAPFIGKIISGAGQLLSKLSQALSKALGSTDFTRVMGMVNSGMLLLVGHGLKKFVNTLNEIGDSVKDGDGSLIERIFGVDIGARFKEAFEPITKTLESMQAKLKAETLKQIAVAIAILAGSIWVLSTIDSESLGSALTATVAGLGELVGGLYAINKITNDSDKNDLKKLATTMVLIAASVAVLSIAIKNLSGLSWGELAVGLAGVGAALIGLGAFLTMTDFSGLGVKVGISILLIAVAIKKLSDAVIALSALSFDEISQGILGLFGSLTLLGAFLTFTNFSQLGIGVGIGLIAVAVAINMMATAVKKFGSMDFDTMIQGLIGLGATLVGLGVFVMAVSGSTNMIGIGIGLIAVAAAINMLANAVGTFGSMDPDAMVQGLKGLAVVLTEMAIALNLMPKGMVGIGVGLLAAGAGIKMISSAVLTMGSIDQEALGQGLLGLGLALAELAIGLTAMTGALPGAAALLVASAALMLLGPALLIFKAVGANAIDIFIGLGGAFVVLAAGTALITPFIVPLLGFSGALIVFAAAAAAVGAALIVVGIGLSALGAGFAGLVAGIVSGIQGVADLGYNLIVGIASIFSNGWAEIGPAISSFCQGIIDWFKSLFGIHSPSTVMADMGRNLIDGLGQGISGAIGAALEAISGIGSGIVSKLGEFKDGFLSGGMDLIDNLKNGMDNKLADARNKAADIGNAVKKKFKDFKSKFKSAGSAGISGFISGMGEKLSSAREKAASIANSALSAMKGVSFTGAGEDAGQGFINGLGNKISGVINKAAELARSALSAVKNTIASQSPSKKTRKLGEYFGEGFLIGIQSFGTAVKNESSKMANGALISVKTMADETRTAIDDMFDLDPTITPVLDLKTLRSQAGEVNRLFSNGSLELASKIQNRGNSSTTTPMNSSVVNNSTQYIQNITSPKPIRSRDIYRQTKNLIALQKGARA